MPDGENLDAAFCWIHSVEDAVASGERVSDVVVALPVRAISLGKACLDFLLDFLLGIDAARGDVFIGTANRGQDFELFKHVIEGNFVRHLVDSVENGFFHGHCKP